MPVEWCAICSKKLEAEKKNRNESNQEDCVVLSPVKGMGTKSNCFNRLNDQTTRVHVIGHLYIWVINYLGNTFPNIEVIQVAPSYRKRINSSHINLLDEFGIEIQFVKLEEI